MTEFEKLLIKSSIEQKATSKKVDALKNIATILLEGIAFLAASTTKFLEGSETSQVIFCGFGAILIVIGLCFSISSIVGSNPRVEAEDLIKKLQELKEKGVTADEAIKELKL